jgi:hypothetical protein
MNKPLNQIIVGVSGNGSTLIQVLRALPKSNIPFVFCNNPHAGILTNPDFLSHNIKVVVIKEGESIDDFHIRIANLIRNEVENVKVYLLGYLKKFPAEFETYNNHPAPKHEGITSGKGFYGETPYKIGLKKRQELLCGSISSGSRTRKTFVWEINIHRTTMIYDEMGKPPIIRFSFLIDQDISPTNLQKLTMLFEKLLTIKMFDYLSSKTGEVTPIKIELSELLEMAKSNYSNENYGELIMLLNCNVPNEYITQSDQTTLRMYSERQKILLSRLESQRQSEYLLKQHENRESTPSIF